MTPTYDKPLIVQFALTGAKAADISAVIPAVASTPAPAGKLPVCKILGVVGVVGTAGAASLQFGDGTDADRYGTFVMAGSLAAGDAVTGEMKLTEEGFRIGLGNDGAEVDSFTVTGTGAGVLNPLTLLVGYFY